MKSKLKCVVRLKKANRRKVEDEILDIVRRSFGAGIEKAVHLAAADCYRGMPSETFKDQEIKLRQAVDVRASISLELDIRESPGAHWGDFDPRGGYTSVSGHSPEDPPALDAEGVVSLMKLQDKGRRVKRARPPKAQE